jgi:hypothetical protein
MQANNAIISLTTIPERLGDTKYGERGVYSCIKSLCEQTYEHYEIHFNIPNRYTLHEKDYEIPEWLLNLQEKQNHLRVYRVEDVGPSTKILPTIERVKDMDTIIIVVDDDMIYRDNLVEEHVKNQSILKNSAIGYDGLDLINPPFFNDPRDHYVSLVTQNFRVKVLQHYKSVSYKRSFFDEDLFTDFVGKTRSDDILISAYMGYKNIPKIVVTYDKDEHCETIEEWHTKVGTSFPIIGPIHHDGSQGCNDPKAGDKFYRPLEFEQKGYLER